jgi:hypothetical protein
MVVAETGKPQKSIVGRYFTAITKEPWCFYPTMVVIDFSVLFIFHFCCQNPRLAQAK